MVYLLPIHLYAAQVDVLREQAIQNYRAGQTQQAVSQLDQLLNKYPHLCTRQISQNPYPIRVLPS
ncbi:hypothetical protein C7R87_1884 [Acinetobacter baumannii]|nr:hypothetical protein C7R87_1884 [Acinetobacter baumannii]